MPARRTTALVAAGMLSLTMAMTSCSGNDPEQNPTSGPAPTAWSADRASNTTDKADEKQAGANRRPLLSNTAWSFELAPESAMVDPAGWPDAKEIYQGEQLRAAFPESTGIEISPCSYGTFESGGNMTTTNTTCSYQIKMGEAKYGGGDPSRMILKLRGIGADSEVTKAWDGKREEARKDNNPGHAFYKDGTYGARRALFRDDAKASFVISDGQIAAWIDLEFIGFAKLDPDTQKVKAILRQQVFPLLVEDLVGKLPRKH